MSVLCRSAANLMDKLSGKLLLFGVFLGDEWFILESARCPRNSTALRLALEPGSGGGAAVTQD